MSFPRVFLLLLLCSFGLTFSVRAASTVEETEAIEINNDDNYTGKRKKNGGSPASRKALSKQTKHAQHSIKRNEKRNRRELKQRNKRQKRQRRYSRTKTFR